MKTCPGCDGKRKTIASGVRYSPGVSGPSVIEMDCIVCNGSGQIDDGFYARLERGSKFANYRIHVLELGLRNAARQWGMSASYLSMIEQGLIETDWMPPGFSSKATADPTAASEEK